MSEYVKPRIFHTTMLIGSNDESWISSKNKDFIDKIFYKEKFKSIELEPTLQLMKEMGEALKGAQHMFEALQYDIKQERGVGCDDKCSSYGHSTSCFLANDIHEDEEVCEVNKVLEKYRKFLEGLK